MVTKADCSRMPRSSTGRSPAHQAHSAGRAPHRQRRRDAEYPARMASTTDSVSSRLMVRQRPAPSDARIAISRARLVHRANMRMATLAHAMRSVSRTAIPTSHGMTTAIWSPSPVPPTCIARTRMSRSSPGCRLRNSGASRCRRSASAASEIPEPRRTTTSTAAASAIACGLEHSPDHRVRRPEPEARRQHAATVCGCPSIQTSRPTASLRPSKRFCQMRWLSTTSVLPAAGGS